MDLNIEALAKALLPGVGFFGGRGALSLKVDVNAEIDEIVISIDAGKPEILNIGAVNILDGQGDKYDLSAVVESVSISTIWGEGTLDKVLSNVLVGRMVHTRREETPVLRIHLKAPIYCSRVALSNRNDFYGSRSRHISIATYQEGVLKSNYVNYDERDTALSFMSLLGELGPVAIEGRDVSEEDILRIYRKKIGEFVSGNPLRFGASRLCQMLPVFDGKVEYHDYYAIVVAAVVSNLLETRAFIDTNTLTPFERILCAPRRIEDMEYHLNKMREGESDPGRYVVSKHNIRKNKLIEDRYKYIDALGEIISTLSAFGVDSIICYGTLLGAVRERSFIAHDDDVDVLYFDGSKSAEESREKKAELIARLREAGYEVPGIYENFHVIVNGVAVDVFPSWEVDGRTTLLMEAMRYREVPTEILRPISTIDLYGHKLPAPANPEAFLEERYGKGWSKPDPYHEWAWRVEREAG